VSIQYLDLEGSTDRMVAATIKRKVRTEALLMRDEERKSKKIQLSTPPDTQQVPSQAPMTGENQHLDVEGE
jgi:hypothetical protein